METKRIRTAIIGLGYRGRYLLQLMRAIDQYDIVAIADPNPHTSQSVSALYDVGEPQPKIYDRDDEEYLEMLRKENLELVIVASPWALHLAHGVAALEAGCHIALEVKGALNEEEYPQLLEAMRRTVGRIFPLENTFFLKQVLSIYQMVEVGVFGELLFLQGGYRHDLRSILIGENGVLGDGEHRESAWRSKFYTTENGDIYPTHGLAPICMMAGVNRSCRIESLSSFSTKARGMHEAIRTRGGTSFPKITMGDVITTTLQTDSGVILNLLHDTTLPRPRSLNFEIQGTRGVWNGDSRQIYIEGVSPYESWENDTLYVEQYLHPYWQEWGEEAINYDQHHQGMDYIMLRAVAEELTGGVAYPFMAEDLATWAAVTPCSKRSIEEGGNVMFPHYN